MIFISASNHAVEAQATKMRTQVRNPTLTGIFFHLISYLNDRIMMNLNAGMHGKDMEGVMNCLRKRREKEEAKENKEREEREEIEFLLTGGYERDCCHS